MGTWEADSDNDLSGTGITALDCYDSQAHDDSVYMLGATNTDATHYREIRSASACATPFAGKANTGANFERVASAGNCLHSNEGFSRFRDVVVKLTNDHAGGSTWYYAIQLDPTANAMKVLNCVVHDSINNGAGGATGGIYSNGDNHLIYNCILYGNQYHGIFLNNFFSGTSNPNAAICCTAIDNGDYGFYSSLQGVAGERIWAWSCYGADNTNGDFRDASAQWSAPSGWNSSKDTTSDLGGAAGNDYKNSNDLITGGELDGDYLPTENIYWANGAGDNAGRNPHNDITSVYDFDDFFKNDAGGEDISKDDIRGVDRPTPDTADVSWDVGAGEYAILPTTTTAPPVYTTTTTAPLVEIVQPIVCIMSG